MANKDFKRKLTAIFSADAVGYSRLMAEDEAATVETIASYREIMASLIKQHRGRVVDSPGDNLLAEFSSVVDAVQCAVAVQNEIQTRNSKLPNNRRMEFRIGINLGDIIDEEDRIYGDGVNIAARLEAMADPGGICVSKTAFDHIRTKLPLGYEYLGEQSVKNIPMPVGAYRVLMKPDAAGKVIGEKKFIGRYSRRTAITAIIILVMAAVGLVSWNIYLHQSKKAEPASLEEMAFALPKKPSIAVLPFDNMGKDSESEIFVDAISDNIIATLSKSPDLFVISRSSSFTYKSKPTKIKQVSEELGVKYVLKGSALKSGERIRVTAQLNDALKGHHLWAETYDRDLKELFVVIDEITLEIAKALTIKLLTGMQFANGNVHTKNLEAWTLLLKAGHYLEQSTKEDFFKAKELLERVIELDPNFSMAWAYLADVHAYTVRYEWSSPRIESYEQATKFALKALELEESNSFAQTLLGKINVFQGNYDEALTHYEKAVSINPNDDHAYNQLGSFLRRTGQPDKAVPIHKKAMRLNPNYSWLFPYQLGRAYYQSRQYDDAIATLEHVLEMCEEGRCTPKWPHMQLTQVYAELGQFEKARYHMQKVLEYDPSFNLEKRSKSNPYKNPADGKREIEALRKAGAPEHPPLQ